MFRYTPNVIQIRVVISPHYKYKRAYENDAFLIFNFDISTYT